MNSQEDGKTKEVNISKVNENLSDDVVKKSINKKIIIGVICIVVIALCVIGYSIYNRNKKLNELNNSKEESELLVNEKDTYEGLNYTATTEYIEQTGFFYDYSKNKEGKKVEVSFKRVSGLKDTQLQDNINNLLQEAAKSLYDESDIQDEEILYSHIYNYTDVYIFNNVLSTLYCKEKCDVDGKIECQYKSVNINLNDLKEIEFKDIFVSSANIEELLNEECRLAYNSSDFVFSFSPKNIYIPVSSNKVEKINLYNIKDYVAIYKRYANNKKIFEKTYNAIPYVFTTKKFSEKDWYGLVEDNLFIDTYNTINYDEYSQGVKENVESAYRDAVNKAKNISYKNPSKRYLVQIIPTVKNDEDKFIVNVECNIYEIEKQFFIDNIEKFIVASENKSDEEIVKVEYFDPAIMDADQYLVEETSENFKKIVDKDGNDLNEINLTNNSEIS